MNIHKISLRALAICSLSMAFAACSSDADIAVEPQTDPSEGVVYTMHFDSASPGFDDEADTRAITKSWANGSVIYIRFRNGSAWTNGTAKYNSSTGTWTVSASSSLPTTSSATQCQLTYIQNPVSSTSSVVGTNSESAAYQVTGTYTHPTSGDLFVTGNLEPVAWRMRFSNGASGTVYTLPSDGNDIQTISSFNITSGEFTWTKGSISMTVDNSGYTPYFHGRFTATNTDNNMKVQIGNGDSYTRTIASSKLPIGKSGCMKLPSSSALNGWTKVGTNSNLTVTLNDIVVFTDGACYTFSFGADAASFKRYLYLTSDISGKDDAYIINKMSSVSALTSDKFDYAFGTFGDSFNANTAYTLCAVAFDSNGNAGKVLRYSFKTLSTSLPQARITNLAAETYYDEAIWGFGITSVNNCSLYYYISSTAEDDYSDDEHWLAYYLQRLINAGSREDYLADSFGDDFYFDRTSTYFSICTWAKNGNSLGNYSYARATTSSNVKPANIKASGAADQFLSDKDLKRMSKNLHFGKVGSLNFKH